MGNLLFEIKAKRLKILTQAIGSLSIALLIIIYFALVWNDMERNFKIILLCILAMLLWTGINGIAAFKKSKILCYENGLVIQRAFKTEIVLLFDITTSRYIVKGNVFEFEFTRQDGTSVKIDSDDYQNLQSALQQYAQMVHLKIRTAF